MPIIGKAILRTVCCVSILVFGNVPANAQASTDEDVLMEHANKPWTGDLDGMVKRGFIRSKPAGDGRFRTDATIC